MKRCQVVTIVVLVSLFLICGAIAVSAVPDAGETEKPGISAISENSQAAMAPTAELHVCPSGCAFSSLQNAVDAAQEADIIKVASGIYTGVSARESVTQVVYISKTVTIEGGYTTTNWVTPDPDVNPTTLDAQGQGRVLYITGDISPTIEGLRITGGNAESDGGGIHISRAAAIIRDNVVLSNHAFAGGGGLYLGDSRSFVYGNTFISNTADYAAGLFLWESPAVLSYNNIASNVANVGGGLVLGYSDATLNDNTITNNSADPSAGGLYLHYSDAELFRNTIADNASQGVFFWHSDATVDSNIVTGNTDGLFLHASVATLTSNVIADNQNTGVHADGSSPRLLHNTIARNTIGVSVADRWQEGTYYSSTVALTNTILVNHDIGINVFGGNTVTVNGVLWYGTPITVSQAVTATVMVAHQNTGDPAFTTDGYHITPASAAMDAGVDSQVTTDIDGHHRPYNSAWDLGADEIIATSVTSDIESALVFTDTQGSPTVVQVPAGAVTDTIVLVYTPVETVTSPANFSFAGHAFSLEAYREGALLAGLTFEESVIVTIHYSEADVAELDEERLVVEHWNDSSSAWEDAACGPYDRHPQEDWLTVPICHLSEFALFEVKPPIYLPVVMHKP